MFNKTLCLIALSVAISSCVKDTLPSPNYEPECNVRFIQNKVTTENNGLSVYTRIERSKVKQGKEYVWLNSYSLNEFCDSVPFEQDTTPIKIFPVVDLIVPSAFTPNGDGTNDEIKPTLVGIPMVYEFIVYNRWGTKVFQTVHPSEAWDGVYGNKTKTDTYSFEVKARFFGKDPNRFYTMRKLGHFSLIN